MRVPQQTVSGLELGFVDARLPFRDFSLVDILDHTIPGGFNVLLSYHDHLKSVPE